MAICKETRGVNMERRKQNLGSPYGIERRGLFDRIISKHRNGLIESMADEVHTFNQIMAPEWDFFGCLYRECEIESVSWREAFEIALLYIISKDDL
jgi:hypothetical protein